LESFRTAALGFRTIEVLQKRIVSKLVNCSRADGDDATVIKMIAEGRGSTRVEWSSQQDGSARAHMSQPN
jgi:hypothetical protein